MIKRRLLTVLFLGLFLLPLAFNSYAIARIPESPAVEKDTFNPVVRPKMSEDVNGNKIHDDLESILEDSFIGDYYTTIVSFDCPVTDSVIRSIKALNAEVLSTWSLVYGAAVKIRGYEIDSLANIPGVTFITQNYESRALLSTSVPQINVRPYVWDTLGYEGETGIAIAIVDTGIDDTHPDFGSRIVAWQDFAGVSASSSGDEYGSETDMGGHGTHCASIAAGSGAAGGTATTVEISGTLGLPAGLSGGQGYVQHVEVETSGIVTIEIQWDVKSSSNSPSDEMFIMIDTNQDGAFTGDDAPWQSGTYSNIPIVYTSPTLSPGEYQFLIGPWTDFLLTDRAVVQYTITRPASGLSDGNNKYRGVAPGCDIVALKALDDAGVGSQQDFLDALDWIETNGATYNIDVVSMSLGFDAEITMVDNAVNNLVSLGYVCVAAAGNGFMDGDYVYSPGTATKAITVGAIDDVDKIAIYSSNGYPGDSKPDVVAPGGAYRYPLGANEDTHPIIAADTNDADEATIYDTSTYTYWDPEMNVNDYAAFQGTSMATPHVAGLAALIIQAMGTDWTHTEANVRFVKNLLCGTATEVQYGETYDAYSNTPTLNRGDRDRIEGFGKVHGDAAIEAFIETYTAGSIVTDSLGSSVDSPQSWARKVELVGMIEFSAGIEIDSGDYDLYLIDPTADMTSSNGILASSTTAGAGLPENLIYTPGADKTAYLVVKRVSGSGDFTLSAEATKTGTPSPTSSPSFLFGISTAIWLVLGTIGIATVVLLAKKRR